MYFYQLVNFENTSRKYIEEIKNELKIIEYQGYRWVEWSRNLRVIAPEPDVSIVYAKDLSWQSIYATLKKSSSTNIILLGKCTDVLALPFFKKDFNITELNKFMSSQDSRALPPRQNRRSVEWVETIPIPLKSTFSKIEVTRG